MPQKHQRLRNIIRAGGGGQFHGVNAVPAVEHVRYLPAYYLVYFDSIRTGSTMCMRTKGITAKAVRAHLIESNKKFNITHPARLRNK